MEDLIQQGSGLDLVERPVIKAEVGKTPRETGDLVVSVLRGHRLLGYDDPAIGTLQLTDRVITIIHNKPGTAPVRPTAALPEAPAALSRTMFHVKHEAKCRRSHDVSRETS